MGPQASEPGGRGELALPAHFFRRADPRPDRTFYVEPRFVTHIDDATIEALTDVYRQLLQPGSAVLDLMSSWVSHLPPEVEFSRVAGLGMNARELESNEQLTDWVVHDLNEQPELPYEDGSFDAVLNAVSIQYLTRPVEVYRSVARVLRPGGLAVIAFSHRLFPTKAVAIWQQLAAEDRIRLVGSYVVMAGGFEEPRVIERRPPEADPLWVVYAHRLGAGGRE